MISRTNELLRSLQYVQNVFYAIAVDTGNYFSLCSSPSPPQIPLIIVLIRLCIRVGRISFRGVPN